MQFDLFRILLSERKDEYIKTHPKTAVQDLKIIEALVAGTDVNKVAQIAYYDRSSIYKRIKRINDFLLATPVEKIDLQAVSYDIGESMYIWPNKGFSMVGYQVFRKLLTLCHVKHNKIKGSQLAQYHPTLRYVQRRAKVLEEIRNFDLVVPNENNKRVRVFESLEYAKHHYIFRLTKDAASYLGL